MHADIHIENISSGSEDEAEKKNQDPTLDLKHFFKKVPWSSGDKKAKVKCICCKWVWVSIFTLSNLLFFIFESQGQGCHKQESILGYDHMTLRRHMASKHKVPFFYLYSLNHHLFFIKKKHQDLYRSWCTKNKFISMLPEDTNFQLYAKKFPKGRGLSRGRAWGGPGLPARLRLQILKAEAEESWA